MLRARAARRHAIWRLWHSLERGSVYCIRTRNIYGRRVRGYIGFTQHGNYATRVNEHLHGCVYHGLHTPPKWWAPRARDYYRLYRGPAARLMEILFIRILFPLYNDRHNRSNPRRVSGPRFWMRVDGPVVAKERSPQSLRMALRTRFVLLLIVVLATARMLGVL